MNKEELAAFLKENLSIRVKNGNFTEPNTRTVELILCDEVISSDYFNVVQSNEYYG